MLRSLTFRLLIPAVLGALLGLFALAYAAQNEPTLPTPFLSLISPGLKIAEMVTPSTPLHRESLNSLGPTFGTFLRIAITINALAYFALFSLLGYLIDRRLKH